MVVTERQLHKERSRDSGFFLLYIEVIKPTGSIEIATAVTGQKRGDLHIGKKGVFLDINGEEHPAQVVDILDNPINLQEAFLMPFSSVKGFVQKRLEKFSLQHQKSLEESVEKNLIAPPSTAPTPKSEEPAKTNLANKAALLNGGVTFAALSSSFAYLISELGAS